jgi:hypothetical protein
MSTEIHLKRENDRLRREISELKAKISELVPKQPEQPVAEKSGFDPYSFSDPVVAALSAIPRLKSRRSWINE